MNPKRHFEPIAAYQTPSQKAATQCLCDVNTASVELIEALKDSSSHKLKAGYLSACLTHTQDNDYVIISGGEHKEELIRYRYNGRGIAFTSGFRFSANSKIEMMRSLIAQDPHAVLPKQPSAPKPKRPTP